MMLSEAELREVARLAAQHQGEGIGPMVSGRRDRPLSLAALINQRRRAVEDRLG